MSEELFADPAQNVEATGQTVQEQPEEAKRGRKRLTPYYEVAWSKAEGKYKWCLWSANGRIVAVSAIGYKNRPEALAAVTAMRRAAAEANHVIQGPDEAA